jgi:hypothetical protein
MADFGRELSIYEQIKANIGQDGKLPSGFVLRSKNGEYRNTPGLSDGLEIYGSYDEWVDSLAYAEITADDTCAAIMRYLITGDQRFLTKEICFGYSSGFYTGIIDDLMYAFHKEMRRIVKYLQPVGEDNDCKWLSPEEWVMYYEASEWLFARLLSLIQKSDNIGVMKVSIMLLAELGEVDMDASIEVLTTLALWDEFTLYSVLVIKKCIFISDKNALILEIAKKVRGWGRVHAIRLLEPETDEIRDWVLRNGCIAEGAARLYLGLTCAKKGNLISALRQKTMDSELFGGVSAIAEALLDERAAGGISFYEHAKEALPLYLRHAEAHPEILKRREETRSGKTLYEDRYYDIEEREYKEGLEYRIDVITAANQWLASSEEEDRNT